MKNIFLKQNYYKRKWYLIDATNKSLGRISSQVCKLILGKNTSLFYEPNDQGNFIIILNIEKSNIVHKNYQNKFYYKKSKSPGHLKKISFNILKKKFSNKILFNIIKKMLPKNKLGKKYYNRIFLFNNDLIIYKKK